MFGAPADALGAWTGRKPAFSPWKMRPAMPFESEVAHRGEKIAVARAVFVCRIFGKSIPTPDQVRAGFFLKWSRPAKLVDAARSPSSRPAPAPAAPPPASAGRPAIAWSTGWRRRPRTRCSGTTRSSQRVRSAATRTPSVATTVGSGATPKSSACSQGRPSSGAISGQANSARTKMQRPAAPAKSRGGRNDSRLRTRPVHTSSSASIANATAK